MHRNALSRLFEKRVSEIRKYLQEIPLNFDPDDVHDFRVEFKKLRALLRLVQLQASSLKLPGKSRKIYHATGNVRSVQLQKEYTTGYTERHKAPHPAEYFQLLNAEELRWRLETKMLLEAYNWDDDAKELIGQLPSSLKDSCIKKIFEAAGTSHQLSPE